MRRKSIPDRDSRGSILSQRSVNALLEEAPEEDAKMEAQMVDLEAVKRFIFPENLQHAMSTGRLFAFGLYGPLDADACLRSGHKGQHVVTCWELDTMCRQFEREDILQVYTLKGQSHSNLSEEQAEELLAQADSRLKVAKGKAMMQQVTREEVDELFSGLERDGKGRLNFHKMQRAIMEYRQDCINRNKVVFPQLTKKESRYGDTKTANQTAKSILSDQKLKARKKGLSHDIAPRSMFLADVGMNSMDVASHTNRLLSTKAFKICNIADGNSSSLTANVRLIRPEGSNGEGKLRWDDNCAKRGTHMGSFVKAEYSTTTVKRRS